MYTSCMQCCCCMFICLTAFFILQFVFLLLYFFIPSFILTLLLYFWFIRWSYKQEVIVYHFKKTIFGTIYFLLVSIKILYYSHNSVYHCLKLDVTIAIAFNFYFTVYTLNIKNNNYKTIVQQIFITDLFKRTTSN